MSGWEFRDPLFLLAALVGPLVLWLAARLPSALRYSSLDLVDHARCGWRVRLAKLPAVLMAIAVVCLAIALAGPRTPDAETKISREGIAIMMVVDRSGSMQARDLVKDDLSVDRLAVVKDVFEEFVLGGDAGEGRPDDLVGLIAFAGYADSVCPLTLDHGSLVNMVRDLEIVGRRDEDGTALGEGLGLAVERLRRSKAKSKVAILLTDGVSNAGTIDPEQAAELAASQNVKVYCIGAGTDGLAPFPVGDPFSSGGQVLRSTYVEIDEVTLKKIAEKTGGQYYRATDQEGLKQIYAEIDRLERTELTETQYLQYTEHYGVFVASAVVLMAMATVASATLFRSLP